MREWKTCSVKYVTMTQVYSFEDRNYEMCLVIFRGNNCVCK
jgi:hypothetical protein